MHKPLLTAIAATALFALPLGAQAQMDNVTIKPTKLADGIHMLAGKGGNIGVLTGSDGTFMIDDQFAPLTAKILAAVKSIGGAVPRFVINTHYHFDHTGGNENLGNEGVTIVSHDNVRKKLAEGTTIKAFNKVMKPAPKAAIPVITFAEEMTFHLNGETIHVFHSPNGHTDGDAIIHFKNANVIHAGDLFFNGFYPFIDTGAGGTVKGIIAAADKMLPWRTRIRRSSRGMARWPTRRRCWPTARCWRPHRCGSARSNPQESPPPRRSPRNRCPIWRRNGARASCRPTSGSRSSMTAFKRSPNAQTKTASACAGAACVVLLPYSHHTATDLLGHRFLPHPTLSHGEREGPVKREGEGLTRRASLD